ncbi:MAG: pyridoxal 5'-phosphate synthase glutaminase subunit PdxT [Syntrophales bacterium]|jgi:5'-phosphate synthase pdxT subunit|nr:pyridoxal 5'-phosphate synthase glutaminase subunit PdxT [Syntrophales bacterium]MDY0043091.1 pyridoxal 5'-phosphate synthase glutaminase subunit PdxT [Syntrophales bacterium]
MKIGILALQGAFREHSAMVKRCKAEAVEVRLPFELETMDGLIMPGGESTAIAKLLIRYGFLSALMDFASSGRPVFGTCAGTILLAAKQNGQSACILPLIDIDVSRNAYGRQRESREAQVKLSFSALPFDAIFIRAPVIESAGSGVEVLSTFKKKIILARQDNILVSTFHPELTKDKRIHRYFLEMAEETGGTSVMIPPPAAEAAIVK